MTDMRVALSTSPSEHLASEEIQWECASTVYDLDPYHSWRRLGGIIQYREHCRYAQDTWALSEILRIRPFLEARYSVFIDSLTGEDIEIRFGGVPFMFRRSSLFLQAVQLRELKAALAKLPPEFLKSFNIKAFLLCSGIEMNIGGATEEVAGASDVRRGIMYLQGIWSVHHELFHFMDAQHQGLEPDYPVIRDEAFIKFSRKSLEQNTYWALLSPLGMQDNISYDEEQADFARMLFNLDIPYVYEKYYLPELTQLGSKAKFEQMKSWLFEWSGGRLDGHYWTDLQAGKVSEDYWDSRKK